MKAFAKQLLHRERLTQQRDLFSRRVFNNLQQQSLSGGAGCCKSRGRCCKTTPTVCHSLEQDDDGYIVHVDQPTCWNALILHYKSQIDALLHSPSIQNIFEKLESVTNTVHRAILNVLTEGVSRLQTFDLVLYQQMQNIAALLNLTPLQILLLQFMYEAHTFCTSVVIKTPNGTVAHGRTMDWDLPELKALSIPVSVYVNQKKVGVSMQWLGCVGMFTIMRIQGYSISINYRQFSIEDEFNNAIKTIQHRLGWLDAPTQSINYLLGYGNANVVDTLLYHFDKLTLTYLAKTLNFLYGSIDATPCTFLLRKILMEESSYNQALSRLKTTPLFTKVYFTIAGINTGEIIARSALEVDNPSPKQITLSTPFIVQPNMDWWQKKGVDVMDSKERICVMEKVFQSGVSIEKMWKAMKKNGKVEICNDITIYSTLFIPSTGKFAYTIGN